MKYHQFLPLLLLLNGLITLCKAQSQDEIITENDSHDAGVVLVHTQNSISSDKKISGNSQITYQAGKVIVLKPGFEVKEGSYFHAGIQIKDINPADNSEEDGKDLSDMQSESFLVIYPNPSQGIFNIEVDAQKIESQHGNGNYQMVLYNIRGEIVADLSGSQNRLYDFDFSRLAKGTYYLKLFTVSKNSSVQPPALRELVFKQIIIE